MALRERCAMCWWLIREVKKCKEATQKSQMCSNRLHISSFYGLHFETNKSVKSNSVMTLYTAILQFSTKK